MLAPCPQNPHVLLEYKMKVEFLTSGSQAHITHGGGGREVFLYKKGETMSGLSEDTARSMVKNKHAKIIGEDDTEIEAEDEEESEVLISSSSMSSQTEKKPWG